jgi:hypothetical protein
VPGAEAANGMICFGVLTYGVHAAAVAIAGFGLWFGLFSGPAAAGLTLVPATLASVVIVIGLSTPFADRALTEFLERRAERMRGRAAKWWHGAAEVPRSVRAGLLAALAMVRRRDPSLLGAVAYWGFEMGFRVKTSLAALAVLGYRTISYWLPTLPEVGSACSA